MSLYLIQEEKTVAPYAVQGNNWLSLDDEESIRIKSEYIKQEGFAGGMVWSIDTDDFWGFCTGTKFGLTHTIAEVINEDLVITDERFNNLWTISSVSYNYIL